MVKLNTIELKPTYSCIQNCVFCCFRDLKTHSTMKKSEIEDNIDYIKKKYKDISLFIISGGEPTILYYFWDMLRKIKKDIKPEKLILHSNCLFFSSIDNVNEIKKYDPVIMISFHTLKNNFYNKFISKKYSLKEIKKAVKNFNKLKIKFVANVLLFNNNLYQLDRITNFLVKNNVYKIEYRLPYTLDLNRHKELLLKDIVKAKKILFSVIKKYNKKAHITIHPSLICLLGNKGIDKKINFIKKFSQNENLLKGKYYFFDKFHQFNKCNKNDLQLSSVIQDFRNLFFKQDKCKDCEMDQACLGYPKELESLNFKIEPLIWPKR